MFQKSRSSSSWRKGQLVYSSLLLISLCCTCNSSANSTDSQKEGGKYLIAQTTIFVRSNDKNAIKPSGNNRVLVVQRRQEEEVASPSKQVGDENKPNEVEVKLIAVDQFGQQQTSEFQKNVNISLYQQLSNKIHLNRTSLADQQHNLSKNFLDLFDSLWKLKNETLFKLNQLDYFDFEKAPKNNNTKLSEKKTYRPSPPPQMRPNNEFGRLPNNWKLANTLKRHFSVAKAKLKPPQKLEENRVAMSSHLILQVGGWYARLNLQMHQLFAKVHTFFTNVIPNSRQQQVKKRRKRESKETIFDQVRDDDTVVAMRQVDSCRQLTANELAECKNSENFMNMNLKDGYPVSAKLIEESCSRISWFLPVCWPQQFRQLPSASNDAGRPINDSVVVPFAPGTGGNNRSNFQVNTKQLSCGLSEQQSNVSQIVRERVDWIWLNLCSDARFRQEYVDNLHCVSLWGPDRAKQTCAAEIHALQNYLPIKSAASVSGAATTEGEPIVGNQNRNVYQQQPSKWFRANNGGLPSDASRLNSEQQMYSSESFESQINSDNQGKLRVRERPQILVNPANQTQQQLAVSSENDREISAKLLCCLFDQFLRCAHRLVVRDCGRPAAQFVINVIARVGHDDMKLICNSGPKANRHKPQQPQQPQQQLPQHQLQANSRNRQTFERIFIEQNYCIDPKIQVHMISNGASGNGVERLPNGGIRSAQTQNNKMNGTSGTMPPPPSSRNKTRNSLGINIDPAFYGSDTVSSQNNAGISRNLVPIKRSLLTTTTAMIAAAALLALVL